MQRDKKEMEKAALSIQKRFRGHQGKKALFKKKHHKALEARKLEDAVLRVQRCWRGRTCGVRADAAARHLATHRQPD